MLNKKIRQEHGILDDFHRILNDIAAMDIVHRLIPGRINRKQSGSSKIYFTCSYEIPTGRKYKMSKGSTSQELFIVCGTEDRKQVQHTIEQLVEKHFSI